MNSVDPEFNEQIFDAAYNVGAMYMDMAMTLSQPDPADPFHKVASNWVITSLKRLGLGEERPAGPRRFWRGAGHGRCVCPLCPGSSLR